MEQLNEIIFSFDAFAEGGGGDVAPFSLRVVEPMYDEGHGFFCRVECPFLREKPFMIFGVDGKQACELSISFVRQSIEDVGAKLIDNDGNQISIPEIDYKPSRISE